MTNPTPSTDRTNRSSTQPPHQIRSRALGDPTRYAIYAEIAKREIPVTVSELTELFGLNHNTIRQHLAKLKAAELIEDVLEAPRGPGRPRLRFRLTAQAAAESNDEGPYERLSHLLLEMATSGDPAVQVGERAGRRLPVDDTDDNPVATLTRAMTAQGFAPHLSTRGDTADWVLGRCPFASAAAANPEVVCALHQGMLNGLAARLGGLGAPKLTARDPTSGTCGVRIVVDDDR